VATVKEKTTHTPGPWAVHSGHTVVPACDASKKLGGSADPDHEAQTYAKVLHGFGTCDGGTEDPDFYRSRMSRDEAKANARLIAAAPDLLTALKQAVAAIRAFHGLGLPSHAESEVWALYQRSPEMQAINAAIAKAEGQS